MQPLRVLLILVTLLSFGLLSNCASSSAGITTSNIPIGNQDYEVVGNGEAQSSWWSFDVGIIGFPLGMPPVDEAVNELIENKQGDALINIRYSTDRSIFLFLTRHRFHLKADVVKLKPANTQRQR
ncbi:MAG: hypothetical protein H3C43_08200 [Leptonema sp. (in: Bacteria)]|nr:hypothetical protein [Leptonema sp. (in: bacteria)]